MKSTNVIHTNLPIGLMIIFDHHLTIFNQESMVNFKSISTCLFFSSQIIPRLNHPLNMHE